MSLLIRMARISLATLASIPIEGCVAEPPQIVAVAPDTAPTQLHGIKEIVEQHPGVPIRVLFIHGMGTAIDNYCDFAPIALSLAATLGYAADEVDRVGASCSGGLKGSLQTISVPDTSLQADLFTFPFHGQQATRSLTFKYLHWAPLVDPIRRSAPLAETGHPLPPGWAWLTSGVKDFMRTHLTDVVAYAGSYRTVMRAAVEKALCLLVDGQPDSTGKNCTGGNTNYVTIIVTHSLGGYMFADAVADLRCYHRNPLGKELTASSVDVGTDASAKVMKGTNLIFMLANPIALLDVSTYAGWPLSTDPESCQESDRTHERGGVLRAVQHHWHDIHCGRDGPLSRCKPSDTDHSFRPFLQFVAISDPNDILTFVVPALTYVVPAGGITDGDKSMTLANVYLGTTANILGIAADPVSAHTNYLTSDRVFGILACGMVGSQINSCR